MRVVKFGKTPRSTSPQQKGGPTAGRGDEASSAVRALQERYGPFIEECATTDLLSQLSPDAKLLASAICNVCAVDPAQTEGSMAAMWRAHCFPFDEAQAWAISKVLTQSISPAGPRFFINTISLGTLSYGVKSFSVCGRREWLFRICGLRADSKNLSSSLWTQALSSSLCLVLLSVWPAARCCTDDFLEGYGAVDYGLGSKWSIYDRGYVFIVTSPQI